MTWRAESESEIVATWDVPPERPELHLQIDDRGALRSYWTLRWGNVGEKGFGYIPCGCGDRSRAWSGRRETSTHLPHRTEVPLWRAECAGIA